MTYLYNESFISITKRILMKL